jgi:hypothetical protein
MSSKTNFSIKELQHFLTNLRLGLAFKVKVYITNEFGYIIVFNTTKETLLTAGRISYIKNDVVNAIKEQFPEHAAYIHMIIVNPREWPFGIGPIQELCKTDEDDSVYDELEAEQTSD